MGVKGRSEVDQTGGGVSVREIFKRMFWSSMFSICLIKLFLFFSEWHMLAFAF